MNSGQFLTNPGHKSARAGKFILALSAGLGTLLGITVLTSCAGSLASAPTLTPPNDKLAEILERGTLVVATDDDYPPQSELTGAPRATNTGCAPVERTADELTGFDIGVAVEIARRLGVEPCFVTPTWTQMTGGSWNDRWDISVASMAITPERVKVLYLSQPYYTTPAVFFVHQDNTTFSKPADLSGHTVGVCVDCTYEFYLEGTLDIPGQDIDFVVKQAQIVAYDTESYSIADLAKGDGVKLDAVLTNLPTGRSAIKAGLPLKQLGGPVFYEYLVAAIDKKHSKNPLSFARKVTAIIQQMHGDGTLLKFSQKYYNDDLTTPAGQYNIQALDQLP
jgi:polar amino acid transport system substrate-binding protein